MATAKRSFLELYALAVCFINVFIGSIAVGIILYAVVGISAPELTLSGWEYSRYQSNDNFVHHRSEMSGRSAAFENMSEQEITQRREEAYRLALIAERKSNGQTVLQFAIVLLIQIVLFITHWRLAKRRRSAD